MSSWLNPGRWLFLAGLMAALIVGYGAWATRQQAIGYERAHDEFRAQATRTDLQRARLAEPVVIAQEAAQVRIRTVTKTLIEKVPVYVPLDACPLPGGFRLLHDAAATDGVLPDPAGRLDAGAVPAQDAAATVVENYGIARANAAQLVWLQAWVRAQQELK